MAVSLIEIVRAAYDEGYSDGVCAGTIFEDVNKGWNESQAQAALTAIMDAGDGVQQCDRDAAIEALNAAERQRSFGGNGTVLSQVCDIFARHRSTAAAAERARIVAWLREQAKLGLTYLDKADNPNSERNYAAGVAAIERAADAIERGEV